ncbi:MAG TPA: type II secretion system protein GspG [Phycisphaerae bacterium]|nr:hypothetical protein [Phycisphaerae bacterium]HOB75059.1 type II secretion system protein GspG [Phycisphaerae bacterium]HOJ54806.1 type II secretion system protein GspG [Phycisphaerae bacterium]HOL26916.1 type II secretion system protein GspG [Phycisphaerae bacterium]HPP20871.1 type II secretion system protein GspG [Phycisphaerae bacterium]
MTRTARYVLLTISFSCGWAAIAPAAELSDTMPADTLLYVAWPGADALGDAAKDTAWGRLMAEPEIKRFRARWNQEIWPTIDRLSREELGQNSSGQAYELTIDLLSAAWRYPTALGFAGVEMTPEGLKVDVAMVIRAKAEARKLAAAVDTVLKVILGPDYDPAEVKVGPATLQEVKVPEVELPLRYGVLGDDLVISIGTKFSAHWEAAEAKTLTDSERFVAAMKATGASPVSPVFFLDIRGIVETLDKFQPLFAAGQIPILGEPGGVQKLLDNLGLGTMQSFSVAMRPDAGGFTTTTFLHAPGLGDGVGALLVEKPLTEEDLKVVPRDVSFASVTNFDLAAGYRALVSAFKAVAPDASEMVMPMVANFEEQIGVRIEQDLLSSFADTWAIYDAPEHGGLWFTGIVAVAELRDGNKLDESLDRIAQAISGAIGDEYPITIREEPYREHTIRYVNTANLPIPLAPAWAMVGNRCVMGFYPQMVRMGIDNLTNPGPTLLDNPDFQRGRKQMPSEFSSISYTDTRDGVRFLYSIVVPLGTALMNMAQGEDIPLDASLLPSSKALTRHLFGNVSVTTTTKDGVLTVSHGAVPIPVASAASSVFASSMMMSIMLPSLARARELAKRTVSEANLSGIARACLVYAEGNRGKLPPDLQTLTEGGKRAYLEEKQLKSPRDLSPAEISYVYVPGQVNTMDPRNIIAYEDPDVHDTSEGLNVAFLDGSVRWIPMDEFEEGLKATKERIEEASDGQDGNEAEQGSNAPLGGRRRAPIRNSKEALARTMVADNGKVATMIKLFRMNMGRYPQSLEELVKVPDDEQEQAKYGNEPYLQPSALEDPWSNELQYKYPGDRSRAGFDLFSLGPDGKESEDDIGNWDTRRER